MWARYVADGVAINGLISQQTHLPPVINQYSLRVTSVAVTTSITDCRDAKDNKFLELAINGQANCIITGDRDLLVLRPCKDISIFHPIDFLNWAKTLSR